jgi:hypothetical protein
MNRFITRILSICTDSFRVFGECAQIISNIWNEIIFLTAFKGILLLKKVWKNQLFGSCMTKKFHAAYSVNMRNDLHI